MQGPFTLQYRSMLTGEWINARYETTYETYEVGRARVRQLNSYGSVIVFRLVDAKGEEVEC